jgi:hypothetical protein
MPVRNNKSNFFVFIANINKSAFVPIINVGCNQHDFRVLISHFQGLSHLQTILGMLSVSTNSHIPLYSVWALVSAILKLWTGRDL